jgi:outer membrane usher protein FimD/PapC
VSGRPGIALTLLTFSVLQLLPSLSRGADSFYLKMTLNGEDKGDHLVHMQGDGDFLVRTTDLATMGLSLPKGEEKEVDGEPCRSLKSLHGVSFVLDERTLTLVLTAEPSLLPVRTIEFRPPRPAGVLYPKDASGFFNYGATYAGGNDPGSEGLDVTGQVGARAGEYLFLSDASYNEVPGDRRLVRLNTNVTRDWRDTLQRLVLGDLSASSGDLGSGVSLGGVGFSKVYQIDPYFLRYPLATVSGMVSLPSTAEVYLGGTRIRTEKLSPGSFQLRDISSIGGRNDISVVIKDPFGQERTIGYPYYFTDTLLDAGLHEYSYNAGFLRRRFGEESNRYGPLAISAFHNFGLSDALTVGGRGEGRRDAANLGPLAVFRLSDAGIVSLSLSGSVRRGGRGGAAGEASHTFQGTAWSTRLFLKGQSRDYAVVEEEAESAAAEVVGKDRYEFAAGAGYGNRRIGTLSADVDFLGRYSGPDRRTVSVNYSRNLGRNASVLLTFRHAREEESGNELFAGVSYYLWQDATLAASYRRTGGADTETVQFQKNLPAGEGWGYRASVERTDSPSVASTTVDPIIQYNARFGSYAAEYQGVQTNPGGYQGSYRLSAYGGVAFVGGTFGFSRPIPDSFGLATVGGLEGIRVYQNGQEMGRTDAKGRLFLPSMGSYFGNQVSIADKDVPIEYAIKEVRKVVSPPLRGGSRIPFDVKRFQAVTGKLTVRIDGSPKPAEYMEARVTRDGKEVAFPTGKGGEFYLEDLAPGVYAGSVESGGKRFRFELKVPDTNDMIIDLGGLTGEEQR